MFNNLFTPKNKKPEAEYFLAVEIHESLIKSAVWQVEAGTTSIVSLGSYELWDSEESLINGIDASLTEAIKGITGQPDRIVLGLPDSWLSENRIHPTKQKLVKRLIKELSLNPIGLVTITEAIVSHLKSHEGIPPTAILLEIYSSKVIVSLVNLGEIQAHEEVGRSDDLARDVEEGLARFDAEKLPARFILTNGSDLENEEQQIISYPWTEKLPFLHIPKVQVLPIDFSIRAIALSGGSEAAKSLGIAINTLTNEVTPSEKDEPGIGEAVESVTLDFSSLGFSVEDEPTGVVEEESGWVAPEESVVEPEMPSSKEEIQINPPRPLIKRTILPKISLPQVAFPRAAFVFLPVLAAFLLITGAVMYYLFYGSVKVVLNLNPVRLAKTLDLAIATAEKKDTPTVIAEKKTLSARVSESIPTTGETTVGEKATGKVTIYTTGATNLKKGSKLYSVNGNLVFNLDNEASLASSSAASCSLISPCTIPVSVTAAKIGTEFNLDKDTQFSVENYPKSTMLAKADSAFSGGTSRTVKAVAKADQEKLLGEASEKIKADIDGQLKAADPDNRSLAVGLLRYTVKDFDHNVGEEATTVSLDLGGDLDVMVYSKNSLLSLVGKKLEDEAGPGYAIQSDQTQIGLATPQKENDDTFLVKATIDAVLLPQIDEGGISKQVKGKQMVSIKDLLTKIPGYKSSRITISPSWPLLTRFLPLRENRYSYSISTF